MSDISISEIADFQYKTTFPVPVPKTIALIFFKLPQPETETWHLQKTGSLKAKQIPFTIKIMAREILQQIVIYFIQVCFGDTTHEHWVLTTNNLTNLDIFLYTNTSYRLWHRAFL